MSGPDAITLRAGFPEARRESAGATLMDGIAVAPDARGPGIGTRLFDAIRAEARARGTAEVRLDVVDTNPRARALYERRGFVAVCTENTGPFGRLFGLNSATQMVHRRA